MGKGIQFAGGGLDFVLLNRHVAVTLSDNDAESFPLKEEEFISFEKG